MTLAEPLSRLSRFPPLSTTFTSASRLRPSYDRRPSLGLMSVRSVEPRQVTVVLCDVVGWTTLAQDTEPEELAEIAQCYRRRCAAIVASHGGMSRSTSATACSPISAIRPPMKTMPNGRFEPRSRWRRQSRVAASAVPVHIGVATGGVVIGDVRRQPTAIRERSALRPGSDVSAFGQAPNLAARLQEKALSGTVVISDHTRLLCRGTFDYRDLGGSR